MRYGSGRPVRLYYTTPQVCESLEIDNALLLQIEKNFPAIVVNKNRAGKKIFRHRDYLLIELTATCLKSGSSNEEIQTLLALAPDRGLDQWVEDQLQSLENNGVETESLQEEILDEEDPLLKLQIPMDFGDTQRSTPSNPQGISITSNTIVKPRPLSPKIKNSEEILPPKKSLALGNPSVGQGFSADKIQQAKRELEEILKILRS